MRVRGTALVHFVFESMGTLTDDEVRQAMVDSIGTQTTVYNDVKIVTEALTLDDVAVFRGIDA